MRAVGFAASPELRTYYYVACGLCLFVVWRAPAWSAPVVVLESAVHVTALCAAVLFAPYLDGPVVSLSQLALDFLISGTAGTLAFYRALARLPRVRAE